MERREARLLSPETPEYSPDNYVQESDSSIKRAAYAADYYESCLQFVSNPNLINLKRLDRALDKVDPQDIDVAEAEKLVQSTRPMLSLETSFESVLWSCQLVVKFQVKKPESRWMGSIDVTERAASSFRDVSLKILQSNKIDTPPEFAYVVQSWTSLIKQGKLEEHHSYPLMTSALQWIFSDCEQGIRRSFVSLIASAYANLPAAMREQIIHDILSAWMRKTQHSATSTLTELVLSLIAVAGEIPSTIWEEAVTIKSRTLIESEAHARHANAVAVANLISRRLIDSSWASPKSSSHRIEFQNFLAHCSSDVHSSHWPSAELFISSFVSSLFGLSKIIKSQKYLSFVFDSLRILNEAFSWVNIPIDTKETNEVNKLVSSAIVHCLDDQQAVYLASRQCVLPNQPYFDYYDALSRRNSIRAIESSISQSDWMAILTQYPIKSYHSKISQMVCDLASQEDLKEQNQVDIFRILEKYVNAEPHLFRTEWLNRLGYATPTVCEALVPLVSTVFQAFQDVELLRRISVRIGAPGAPQFKKRVLALLDNFFVQHREMHSLAWQYCLIAATDGDSSVKSAALAYAHQWFNYLPGPETAEELVHAQDSFESSLVQKGMSAFVTSFRDANGNRENRVQSLVKQLLNMNRLDLALVFIRVDGGFTPLSKISTLFESAVSEDHMQALSILECALRSRPRIILSPSLTTKMFATFLNQLKTSTFAKLENIGSILGQLVMLGSPQVQNQRREVLKRVAVNALRTAERYENSKESVVFRQSVMICGCMRFWGVDLDEIRAAAHMLISWIPTSNDEVNLSTKQILIRTVFGFACEYGILFSDPKVDALFSSFGQGSSESALFTRLLLKYMWTSSNRLKNDTPNEQLSHKKNSLLGINKVSNDTDASKSEASSNSMLQKHLARLVSLAREEEDAMTLRVVVKAVEDNLLVADECLPVVTALCFSSKSDVSQIALRSFVTLCERWPRNVGVKFVEGLRMVGENEATAGISFFPLRIMWQVLKESLKNRNIKPMLNNLAQLFKYTTSLMLLELIISGLMEVEMDSKDARYLVTNIEDEVNQFDPAQHEQEDIAKTIIVYVFVLWIKRRYGLSIHTRESSGLDEDLEPLNCRVIWDRYTNSEMDAKESLDQLWRLPDWYGTDKMNSIVYGACGKRTQDEISETKEATKRIKGN